MRACGKQVFARLRAASPCSSPSWAKRAPPGSRQAGASRSRRPMRRRPSGPPSRPRRGSCSRISGGPAPKAAPRAEGGVGGERLGGGGAVGAEGGGEEELRFQGRLVAAAFGQRL